MARDDFAELEIRTWEDVLADSSSDLTSPSSALRAWSAVGMLRCLKMTDPPKSLLAIDPILRACEELEQRDPRAIVASAIDAEGDLGVELRTDLWLTWSADAAAVAAMNRAVPMLRYPIAIADPLSAANALNRKWQRAIRCQWRELAPYGIGLARAHVRNWRDACMSNEANLFYELLDHAEAERANPGSYRVCSWGFGEDDASDHAFDRDGGSEFARHLAACALCAERVLRASPTVDSSGSDEPEKVGRIIPFHRNWQLAASDGTEPRVIDAVFPEIGSLRMWLTRDDVLAVAPGLFEQIRSISIGSWPMKRDEASKKFELRCPPSIDRDRFYQSEIDIRFVDERDPIKLRHDPTPDAP